MTLSLRPTSYPLRTLAPITLLAFAVAGGFPALAAEPAGSFGESIDVRVVNIEVVVTDRDGLHVPDLGVADFELRVDGKPMPIAYFTEIRERSPVAPSAPDADAAAPALPAPMIDGDSVGTSLVLFIDELFGTPWQRDRALDALEAQIPQMSPGDRLTAVVFDGTTLHQMGEWASGEKAIRTMLRDLHGRVGGLRPLAELTAFDARRRSPAVSPNVLAEIRRLSRDVISGVRAAELTLRAFAGAPGRKVMLLASGGWPMDAGTYLYGFPSDLRQLSELRSAGPSYSIKRALDGLSATANLLGFTVYPVDLPGRMRPGGGIDATEGGSTVVGAITVPSTIDAPPGPQPLPEVDAPAAEEPETFSGPRTRGAGGEREIEVESSLLHVAEQTGGIALLDGKRDLALGEVLKDVASYYWLGFTATRENDDAVHRVSVETRRPGLRVRSRRSYRDGSPRADVEMAMEGALLFANRLSGSRPLVVAVSEPRKAGRRLEIPIELRIPLDEIAMLPAAGGFAANLELRVGTSNDLGDRSDLPLIPVRLAGPQPPPPGAHALYSTTLRLADERQRVVIALHDPATNVTLSTAFLFDPKGKTASR